MHRAEDAVFKTPVPLSFDKLRRELRQGQID
jgi:hypothetical protein